MIKFIKFLKGELILDLKFGDLSCSFTESLKVWNLVVFEDFLPTFELSFRKFFVRYRKCSNYSKKIDIKSENLFGWIYSYTLDKINSHSVLMQGFINNVTIKKVMTVTEFLQIRKSATHHSLKDIDVSNNEMNSSYLESSADNILNRSVRESAYKFVLDMETSPEGSKKIKIDLSNLDIFFNLNILFRIIGFVSTDNSVNIVSPKGKIILIS